MAAFHPASAERVNAFRVGEECLFKHYFDEGAFEGIKRYYESYDYRFEVPVTELEAVRGILSEHGYRLVVVEDPAEYAVAVRKYTNHPDDIFRDSVFHRSRGNFNVFVMKDREAVERAVSRGARRLSEAPVDL